MRLLVLNRAGGLVLGVQPTGSTGEASPITTWTSETALTSQTDLALRNRTVDLDDSGAGGPAAYSPMSQAPWVVRAALPASALADVTNLRIAVFSICGALALLFLAAVNLVNRALRRQEVAEASLIVQSAAMEHAAMHDPLTGLPNRLLFNDRLQHGISNARRSASPLALFVLDIDGFKALNDALGHTAGDTVLKETAARLQASVRVSDTVARLGGDEFVIVAVDANPADAELIRAKVQQRMEEPILIDERPVPVGLSIGLAAYPEDGTDRRTCCAAPTPTCTGTSGPEVRRLRRAAGDGTRAVRRDPAQLPAASPTVGATALTGIRLGCGLATRGTVMVSTPRSKPAVIPSGRISPGRLIWR